MLTSVAQAQVVPGVPNSPTSAIVNDVTMRAATGATANPFRGRAITGNWRKVGRILYGGNGSPLAEQINFETTSTFLNFETTVTVSAPPQGDVNRGGLEFLRFDFVDSIGASRTVAYQFDFGQGFWGTLSDQGTRNRTIIRAPQSPLKNATTSPGAESYNQWAAPVVDQGGFNDLRLVVEFPRIRGYVNGVLAFDYTETDFDIVDTIKTAIARGDSRSISIVAEPGSAVQIGVQGAMQVTPLSNDPVVPLGTPELSQIGRWMPPQEMGIIGINTHLLPNGLVLVHDSSEDDNHASNFGVNDGRPSMAALLNPATGQLQSL
ncbi:MAG: hypothetical protein AAFV38_10505, partial [Pseudomonadota bacterium]